MATLSEPDRLSDDESADLFDRVEKFRAAWKADGSGGMARFLPPRGARHRLAVLVQVAVADMERRAAAGLPFRVETYAARFARDVVAASPPVALLIAEYRLRHQFTDRPDLGEYRERFPARFDELVRGLEPPRGSVMQPTQPSRPVPRPVVASVPDIADLAKLPPPAAAPPPPDHSGVTQAAARPKPGTDGPRKSTLHDSRPAAPKARGSKVGDLVVTRSGDLDATPVRGSSLPGKSTILPNDAPYELLRKLGEGAFGEVFEALAPGGIRVAVKRISRNVDHPASLAEREALEVVKNLSHPFLLKTQAYWVFDDRLVIVMELADGSLADKVTEHRAKGRIGVPPDELIPLFEQAAKALDYLHSQNVSHRDIKPENILILKDHAKVGDFGLARPQEHTMTMVGQTVGTPAYMAPEMWQQKVSIHSDQYSLAATYVRCRLDRNLFDTTVLIEMASFHIHETPDLAPLSAAEQAVLLKALAKNPDDRYPSCVEFAAALRAAVLSPSIPGGTGSHVGLQQGGTAIRNALVEVAPPSPLRTLLPMAAIGLACVITMIVALKIIMPPQPQPTAPKDEKSVEKTVVPPQPSEKKFAEVPDGWGPLAGADVKEIGGKHYHTALKRRVADEDLVAVLLYKMNPSDPDVPPYYMLKNKVTNRVFAEVIREALKAPAHAKTVNTLKANIKDFPAGDWQGGAVVGGQKLGVTGPQAGVPVVRVTFPEALLAARQLGGRLPTFLEWKHAAGTNPVDPRYGPAGPPLEIPNDVIDENAPERATAFKRKALEDRKLALGRTDGPQPIDHTTTDLSEPWGVHQLVSNGVEWLGQYPGATEQLINPDSYIPSGLKYASVIGRAPNEFDIALFEDLRPGAREWHETSHEPSFRVVLIPK